MSKRKRAIFYLSVIVIAGASGIVADRILFPPLFSTKLFARSRFLRSLYDNVTVINKTEQVYVKEESSLGKVASQQASSVVNIAYYPSPDSAKKSAVSKEQAVNPTHLTGMIATSDGLIITYATDPNPENLKYSVTTADGNTHEAAFYGFDSYSNVLFLKIEAANLPVVSFGNSDDISAGEKTIAIGNSLSGYGTMISSGVIRDFDPSFNLGGMALSSSEKMEGVFEAAMDSQEEFVGGPVIDYSGQVIGMTGKIASNGQDRFFVIPSNKLRNVIDKGINKKLDSEASLGAYYLPISKAYASANSLASDKGALVYSPSGQQGLAIISGSSADKSGLRIGDIITKISDKEIDSANTLPDILYGFSKGDAATITVLREGTESVLQATL